MKLISEKKIDQAICYAWIAAAISASVTLLVCMLTLFDVQILPGENALGIVDVAILVGLAYGVYRRSRVCAVLPQTE